MTITDAHTHVISPDTHRYPVDPIGGKQSSWSKDHPVDERGLLEALDAAAVDRAVVVQASTVYGHDNTYLADVVGRHRDRLVGVYSLDALDPEAVEKIRRWQDRGLAGFRLFTTGTTMPGQADWLGHPDSFPAWEYAEAHAIPVCLQMTMSGLPTLHELLERFPATQVVLDHCARPDLADGPPYERAQALLDLASFHGVHLKLTHRALAAAAEGTSTVEAFLAAVVDRFGEDRLLWGSNYPAAEGPLRDLVEEARTTMTSLPAATADWVFGRTADRVYFATGGRDD